MKKVMVGVTVALALATSNAAADGIDRRPPPSIAAPAPVYVPTWTGFYIGAGVGAGVVLHDVSLRDFGDTVFDLDRAGADGVLGTAIVGWDWQIGQNTVFGLFADVDFSNISHDHRLADDFFRQSIDHNNTWSVGARLGVLSSPSVLWYVTAGYAQAEFDVDSRFGILPLSGDDTFAGWFLGGGIDTRLGGSNWFLRAEYRFSQFESQDLVSDDGFTRVEFEPTMHSARLALTYKFSGTGYGWSGWNGWGR